MAHNLACMARLFKEVQLKHLMKEAEHESSDKCSQRHGESK